MKTTEEKNRMIAEFIGVEEEQTEQGEFVFAIKFQNPKKLSDFQTEFYYGSELKFHTSWDWLMPVVKKINGLTIGTGARPFFDMIMTFLEVNEIENAYISVVKFIEWYNENK